MVFRLNIIENILNVYGICCTNWVAFKEAERSANESFEHLIVQFYRGDHANDEEMNSTSNRKQKQATD